MTKKRRHVKLPNGFGSINYLGDNRRNPYGARVTCGWDENGTAIRKYIGYTKTYHEAFKLLSEYNNSPYNIDLSKMTFAKLYDKWLPIKEKEVSKKSINRYTNAFKYFEQLHNKEFAKINYYDIQSIIDSCPKGYDTKSDIRSLYCQMYEYAIILEIPVKERFTSSLKLGERIKSTKHTNISNDDLKTIMRLKNGLYEDMIKFMCFTGLRPSEIITLENRNVYIEEKYMTGGIKTEAGKNRIIPINNIIQDIVINNYNTNNKYLFCIDGTKQITYRMLENKFNKIMQQLNMNYKLYDCRHTFATNLDYVESNQLIIKLLMGHKVSDITKGTYTHKNINDLLTTVNKLSIFA